MTFILDSCPDSCDDSSQSTTYRSYKHLVYTLLEGCGCGGLVVKLLVGASPCIYCILKEVLISRDTEHEEGLCKCGIRKTQKIYQADVLTMECVLMVTCSKIEKVKERSYTWEII